MKRSIEELLLSGGDERLNLKENGLNKYFIQPHSYIKTLLRGSCTCNPLNSFSEQHLTNKFSEGNLDFIKVREDQRNRISKLYNYKNKDEFDVIFAPSGSDLPYLPLLFSKVLYPKKDIKLLLTCPEELGSGSQLAFLGKHYSSQSQFGDHTSITEDVNPLYNIGMDRFSARNESGNIINNTQAITDVVNNEKNKAIIGALVIGSKSGIEDDMSIIPDLSSEVMWVVDLCQLRNSKKLVNDLLSKNCLVMITGSKFYMSPPFSGAMLVPKKLSASIKEIKINSVKEYFNGYNSKFSMYDFPERWDKFRRIFTNKHNDGLVVRWEAALELMNRFDRLPSEESNSIINKWNQLVKEEIKKAQYLELMPEQDKTNKTIISFRIKGASGKRLDYDQLKSLHKKITFTEFNYEKFSNVLIGQPVRYSNGAFLRLAIGAYNILKISKKKEEDRYGVDEALVSHINTMAAEFKQ